MRNIIVTSALPYANAPLHLGHMFGYVQADIWVRFQKMFGNQCHFVCGSDTHGAPIMIRAKQENIRPEKLVAVMAENHMNDFVDFGVEFDNYNSTHNAVNKEIVEEIYLKLQKNNLIESKTIMQAYDSKEKMFLPDRFVKGTCPKCKTKDQYGDNCESCGATYNPLDLIDPVSSISGVTPEQKSSEHFFFSLSKMESSIKKWLENDVKLQPEVANKLKEWFEQGLKDWDISRDEPYFGFEIPNTNGKKFFYVWMDAPIGYIASFKDYCNKSGVNFDDYWKSENSEIYHFIGKDIIYFHALFWPAILMATDYKLPTGIFANGFLTINGKKMSKSRGTFILAQTYLKHFPSKYLRYYFASKLTPKIDDFDLSLNDFVTKINSDLVGKLANIASRSAGFIANKNNSILSKEIFDNELFEKFCNSQDKIAEHYEKREFSQVVKIVMGLADLANQFVDHHKPWQLTKIEGNEKKVNDICSQAINLFKILIGYLKPIIPSIATEAEKFLNIEISNWQEITKPLFDHKINKFKSLIERIDIKTVDKVLEDSRKEMLQNTTNKTKVDELNLEPEISIDDFMKVDMRVAKIVKATHVDGADKLLCLILELADGVTKQVFAGIKSSYDPEQLIGKHTVMVANLAPRKMKFGMSEGMVVAAGNKEGIYILEPHEGAKAGMRVK